MGMFRFLLALIVAADHAVQWGSPFIGSALAVECFYMVSGFLMALVLNEKYSTPKANGVFWKNRVLRIFVTYYVCLALIIPMTFHYQWGVATVLRSNNLPILTWLYIVWANISLVGGEIHQFNGIGTLENALVHLAQSGRPSVAGTIFIPQSWSLSLEIWFYMLAPFIVRRHWSVILALFVASAALRVFLGTHGFSEHPWNNKFFPFELSLFLAGALSYHAYRAIGERGANRKDWMASLLILGLCAVYPAIKTGTSELSASTLLLFVCVTLALPAMHRVSSSSNIDRWVGELSYPFYLLHGAFLQVPFGYSIAGNNRSLCMILNIGLAIIAAALMAVLAHFTVDRLRGSIFRDWMRSHERESLPNKDVLAPRLLLGD